MKIKKHLKMYINAVKGHSKRGWRYYILLHMLQCKNTWCSRSYINFYVNPWCNYMYEYI